MHELQPQLHALYQEIADDSGFNDPPWTNTISHNEGCLGDDFPVQGYLWEGQLIGFLSGVINLNGEFEAHFGLCQPMESSYKLYLNMLLDLVELAIQHRSTSLIFARLGGDQKLRRCQAVNPDLLYPPPQLVTNLVHPPLLDYLNRSMTRCCLAHPFKQRTGIRAHPRITCRFTPQGPRNRADRRPFTAGLPSRLCDTRAGKSGLGESDRDSLWTNGSRKEDGWKHHPQSGRRSKKTAATRRNDRILTTLGWAARG